ncbi:ribokinase [Williamsia sp. 1138]|uniref:ribokinase n=1 Tax=Williamsia sp. 1138 TaxID=1903117 RepID=UPI00143D76A8|nr:ribokinase [Williamsia sp. 1138]
MKRWNLLPEPSSRPERHNAQVVVFGSINADTSVFVNRLPGPGQTVHATRLHRDIGGKGANQACAASFAGADTVMVGNVGNDNDATRARNALWNAGVDETSVRNVDAPTGTAFITVDFEGENTIVVAAGANALMTAERAQDVRGAGAVVLQLEIPIDAVLAAARASTGITILNAAPAVELSAALLDAIDVLVVNETELDVVSRPFVSGGSTVHKARSVIGPSIVVVTLGAEGALFVQGDSHTAVPAPSVAPVDTTGAGDCFVGTLAAHLVAGHPIEDSVGHAVAAASETTLFEGARGYLSQRVVD